MSAPGNVPYFFDAELRNDLPDSAALARRLVRWQRWCYERMTGQTPCWARASRTFQSTGPPAHAYRFYVPAPPAPNRTLRVWFTDAIAASNGTVGFRSQRTGTIQWVDPSRTDGSGRTATITIDAPDIVDVYVRWKSGTSPFYLANLSAWWEPVGASDVPGVTLDTSWAAISQNAVAALRPDSTYLLRWLARKANQLMNDRQRAVFSSAASGRRYLRIAPFVPGLTIWVYIKSSAARTYFFNFYDADGSGAPYAASSVLNVPGDNTWAWRSLTFATGYTTGRTVSIAGVPSGAGTSIAAIAIEEDQPTAVSLGLPAGETIPAAFVEVDDLSIRGRSAIWADLDAASSRAHGRKALVENMVYLWAKKVRTLYVENPIAPGLTFGSGTVFANTEPPSYQTQEIVRYRATPDGWAKQLRVAGSAAIGDNAGVPYTDSGGQGIAIGQWAAENGGAGVLKTLTTRIPAKEWPNEWYVEEAPAVASGAAFIFRHLLMNPPAVGQPVKAFANGLVVEELPKGTATTAWP